MRLHRETLLRISSLALLAAGVTACDQPQPKCNIARGSFSARYRLVEGTIGGGSECEATMRALAGEELWVEAYTQAKPGTSRPDSNHLKIGILSTTQQGIITRAGCSDVTSTSTETPYALGAFVSAKPDNDDFCYVPVLTTSQVTVPEQESAQCDPCQPPLPAEPAHDARYEWSNVRVYVTAAANGTQFGADLKYAVDGCSAQFKVSALYPSVSCAGLASTTTNPATGDDAGGEDGGLVADAGAGGMDATLEGDAALGADSDVPADDGSVETDAGEFVPPDDCDPPAPPSPDPVADESLCSQSAPITGGASGSNINPDFMVQCDPQQLRCVLSGDPPSLR